MSSAIGRYVLGDPDRPCSPSATTRPIRPTPACAARWSAMSGFQGRRPVPALAAGLPGHPRLAGENRQAVRDAKAEVAKGIADQRPPEDQAATAASWPKAQANLDNLEKSLPAALAT